MHPLLDPVSKALSENAKKITSLEAYNAFLLDSARRTKKLLDAVVSGKKVLKRSDYRDIEDLINGHADKDFLTDAKVLGIEQFADVIEAHALSEKKEDPEVSASLQAMADAARMYAQKLITDNT